MSITLNGFREDLVSALSVPLGPVKAEKALKDFERLVEERAREAATEGATSATKKVIYPALAVIGGIALINILVTWKNRKAFGDVDDELCRRVAARASEVYNEAASQGYSSRGMPALDAARKARKLAEAGNCEAARNALAMARAKIIERRRERYDMGTVRSKKPVWTLDGRRVNIKKFIRDNAETFDEKDRQDIARLPAGGKIVYGGGAAATFVLRRVS